MNPPSQIIDIDQAKRRDWDVIIIGSGMGGASAAYQLSKYNRRVLIVEKGLASFDRYDGVETPETNPDERIKSGIWPNKLTATVNNKTSQIWAPLGCGAGGSTLLYAAALQRLEPNDFTPTTLPSGHIVEWPFSYDDLAPYYEQVEQLFSVCGSNDPLSNKKSDSLLPPPAMCEADQHFFQHFQSVGLHPYRLHAGIKYEKSCLECGGHICKRACKQDANNACLQPALKTNKVFFIEKSEVIQLIASKDHINSIVIKSENTDTQELSAKIIVMAAGAYFTPVILQNSICEDWPQGISNSSGLIGKNLMFHSGHHIAFWPTKKCSREGANKTIAFRDFYSIDGKKYGEFQSTGLRSNYGNVVYALGLLFDQSIFRKFTFLKHFLRIPAFIASKLYGEATVFATILEDFPYEENRIIADNSQVSGMRFEYKIHEELKERTLHFKALLSKRLKPLKNMAMAPFHLNYGHPCGTCKAGTNPKESVIDQNCKSHELTNLYIVDASFMPTSGGTNPSLTVAANALRVADKINEELEKVDT